MKSLEIKSSDSITSKGKNFISNELNSCVVSNAARRKICIACDEMLSNIEKYAFDGSSGVVTLNVELNEKTNTFEITLIDNGKPFDPMQYIPEEVNPTAKLNKIGGMGIKLTRGIVDEFSYRYEDNKNILFLAKKVK